MPSLRGMLKDTMLFVAAKGKGTEPQAFTGNSAVGKPALPDNEVEDAEAEQLAIWHWRIGSTPNVIEDLSCIARGMNNTRMLVCEKIEFANVIVNANGKQSSPLPLNDSFILQKFYLEAGRINPFNPSRPTNGTHFLYPLKAEVDKSFLFVYAFDFPNGLDQAPVAVAASATHFENFMPPPADAQDHIAKPGEQLTISLAVPRVVVFQSLICCKERNDFDPGGLLGGGRMVPHLMIMVNQPASSVFARVAHQRPAAMTMLEHSKLGHHDHSNMNATIENGLWADRNDPGIIFLFSGIPAPFWDDLFDCYLLGNSSGIFEVVRPDKKARNVNDAVEVYDALEPPFGGKIYRNRNFSRLPRQGAFDNLHLAPTMTNSSRPAGAPYYADRVYMAPFCEHDCLHMHWRWSQAFPEPQNCGWSPAQGKGIVPGQPHKVAGAPLVPENQHVGINITGLNAYEYRVHAEGATATSPLTPIPPGTYTMINHHGSAYALSVNGVLFAGAKTYVGTQVGIRDEPNLSTALTSEVFSSNTVFLYWHLRWGGESNIFTDNVVRERVRITDRAKIRDT